MFCPLQWPSGDGCPGGCVHRGVCPGDVQVDVCVGGVLRGHLPRGEVSAQEVWQGGGGVHLSPRGQNDRRLWKHNLSANTVAAAKITLNMCKMIQIRVSNFI